MKYIFSFILLLLLHNSRAQTMRWIASGQIGENQLCQVDPDMEHNLQCYVLEYVPSVSGLLTSYTTGFLLSCTSGENLVVKNESCTMLPKNAVTDGCLTTGFLLVNSSGNSGSGMINQVVSGKPVILSRICFNIPAGESISLQEDTVTNLTTSVDLGGNQFVTEFPVFETTVILSNHNDVGINAKWFDFRSGAIGYLTSLLQWSGSMNDDQESIIIERSANGVDFISIGVADHRPGPGKDFQFIDRNATPGANFYRLKSTSKRDELVYSPVRMVWFHEDAIEVSVTPSPADDKLFIHLKNGMAAGNCILVDGSGKERLRLDFEQGMRNFQLETAHLEEGAYTVFIIEGDVTYMERVVIIH